MDAGSKVLSCCTGQGFAVSALMHFTAQKDSDRGLFSLRQSIAHTVGGMVLCEVRWRCCRLRFIRCWCSAPFITDRSLASNRCLSYATPIAFNLERLVIGDRPLDLTPEDVLVLPLAST